jgi:hypothetical protein
VATANLTTENATEEGNNMADGDHGARQPLLSGTSDFDPTDETGYDSAAGIVALPNNSDSENDEIDEKRVSRPQSELGPAQGPEIDPEEASEAWASSPVTVTLLPASIFGSGCASRVSFQTTQKGKSTIYMYLLFAVIIIEMVTGIFTQPFVASLGKKYLNAKASIDNAMAWVQFVEVVLTSGLTSRISSFRSRGKLESLRQHILAGFIVALGYGVVVSPPLPPPSHPLSSPKEKRTHTLKPFPPSTRLPLSYGHSDPWCSPPLV